MEEIRPKVWGSEPPTLPTAPVALLEWRCICELCTITNTIACTKRTTCCVCIRLISRGLLRRSRIDSVYNKLLTDA